MEEGMDKWKYTCTTSLTKGEGGLVCMIQHSKACAI